MQPRAWIRDTLDHNLRHLIWSIRCRLIIYGVSRHSAIKLTSLVERCLKRFWILG